MNTAQSVILCHKCGGDLTGRDSGLFGCHCISGYVRDWQVAIPWEKARIGQMEHYNRWLDMFGRRDRTLRECLPLMRQIAKLESLTITP